MKSFFKRLWKEEDGQGMIEWGLIIALIAIVCIAVLTSIGNNTKDKLDGVNDALAPSTTE